MVQHNTMMRMTSLSVYRTLEGCIIKILTFFGKNAKIGMFRLQLH